MTRWSASDLQALRAKQLREPKPSKYRNVKVTVGLHVFDSKREAARYHELKLMQKAGKITTLQMQPEFPVVVKDKAICTYRADFQYWMPDGRAVVEDVKGMKTPVYRLKKKLVEALYGITIKET